MKFFTPLSYRQGSKGKETIMKKYINKDKMDHKDHIHEKHPKSIQHIETIHHEKGDIQHSMNEHKNHMHHNEDTHDHKSHHDHHDHHKQMVADFRKRFWVSLVFTLPILFLSPLIQKALNLRESLRFSGDIYILFGLSTVVFLYGGYPFLKGLWNEIKAKNPGMMTLIGVAITTAYIYSTAVVFGLSGKMFFWELVTLVDIMLLGHWIEMKSVMGASRALEELAKLMPQNAHKIFSEDDIRDVPLGELKPKDKVIVKPGEKIPADGVVVKGETSVNESMLTGESKPVPKAKGEIVIGGSINGEGAIVVEITKTGEDSFLSQVIELVKEAQKTKSKTQDFAGKAAFWLTIIALSGGAITYFIWTLIAKQDIAFALERTVTVMVITCPHALGLAVPLVVAVSTAISAKHGLLIRNRIAFENARKVQAIIFDKTGTLTKGEFGVTDIIILNKDTDRKTLITYAASVETNSEHPIAKGITKETKKTLPIDKFKAIPGKGAEGEINGKKVKVVSPGYLKEYGYKINNEKISKVVSEGKTVVFIIIDDHVIGAIALSDIIRPESKEVVDALRKMGIESIMLTGDSEKVAKWVAKEIGIFEYFAEVLPGDKAKKVKEIQSRGKTVAMTGDGVNDAPALTQADIGIAIGAGTEIAIQAADIILVKSNPKDVVTLIRLAKATYKKMVQNLAWATGYNLIAIPLAAGVLYQYGILLSPAAGAFLMSLSTVIVAINAKFLRFG